MKKSTIICGGMQRKKKPCFYRTDNEEKKSNLSRGPDSGNNNNYYGKCNSHSPIRDVFLEKVKAHGVVGKCLKICLNISLRLLIPEENERKKQSEGRLTTV